MSDHTKKTYDEIADLYHQKRQNKNDSGWNEYLEVPAMESLLKPLVNKKKVLDLGCGTGILSHKIQSWGGEVSGLELSPKMIEIGKVEHPNIAFTQGSAESIPFQDQTYDVVASSLVMHYIQDLGLPFKEVARVLKSHGHFVFSIHHPFNESFNVEKEREGKKVIMKPYFHNNLYHWKMCGAELESYHHTFENIVHALSKAGFALLDMIETKPSTQVKDQFQDYEFASNYPTFCVLKTVKLA